MKRSVLRKALSTAFKSGLDAATQCYSKDPLESPFRINDWHMFDKYPSYQMTETIIHSRSSFLLSRFNFAMESMISCGIRDLLTDQEKTRSWWVKWSAELHIKEGLWLCPHIPFSSRAFFSQFILLLRKMLVNYRQRHHFACNYCSTLLELQGTAKLNDRSASMKSSSKHVTTKVLCDETASAERRWWEKFKPEAEAEEDDDWIPKC